MKQVCVLLFILFFSCSKTNISKWPNGDIIYKFEPNVSKQYKGLVIDCMKHWEIKTKHKINFIYCKSCNPETTLVITIHNKNYSYATIGYVKYPVMCIQYNIIKTTILHELSHVIGLTHEHQRPDRDKYIQINWNNVLPQHKNSFMIRNINDLFQYNMFQYDYNSITHYNPTTGTSNKDKPTIVFKQKIQQIIHITQTDIKKVLYIYK